ncbi:multidrug efflux SMR transporter [Sphingosinicellaceae bacterium A1X5R2]|uniref:DMT family transporter n=1 Tax=Pedomonas mirosovicensis TaxID=2908641 RepID=UPI002167C5B9|nr:multidrug efflux SMR transporter [Pedomonas mirosovicensis]
MGWILLFVAGLLEVAWMYFMKMSDGFTRAWPSVGFAIAAFVSMWLLSQATRFIPVGTAYAVWMGVGAVGGAVMGIVLFREPATLFRIASILLVVAGVVGLKLAERA